MGTMTDHPLAKWRESKGLTQAAAGVRFDVNRWTINSIEVGRRKPSPDLAKRISEQTGIPRHDLRPDLWDAPAEVAA